jgi:hypothetical protein
MLQEAILNWFGLCGEGLTEQRTRDSEVQRVRKQGSMVLMVAWGGRWITGVGGLYTRYSIPCSLLYSLL